MKSEYLTLFFLTIGNYLNYIDRSVTNSFLPIIGNQFNITKSTEGALSSSYLVGYAISAIIFCIMTHKFKERSILYIGCIIGHFLVWPMFSGTI